MIGLPGKLHDILGSTGTRFARRLPYGAVTMIDSGTRKALIPDFIEVVRIGRDLEALDRSWAADCLNHAATGGNGLGLVEIRADHKQLFKAFVAFSDVRTEVT